MDAETLSLLRELQPKIREKMGRLAKGDQYITPDGEYKILKEDFYGELYSVDEDGSVPTDDCILIPDAISRDPSRPERGLFSITSGPYNIDKVSDNEWYLHGAIGIGPEKTLSICLLKYLSWQVREEAEK